MSRLNTEAACPRENRWEQVVQAQRAGTTHHRLHADRLHLYRLNVSGLTKADVLG